MYIIVELFNQEGKEKFFVAPQCWVQYNNKNKTSIVKIPPTQNAAELKALVVAGSAKPNPSWEIQACKIRKLCSTAKQAYSTLALMPEKPQKTSNESIIQPPKHHNDNLQRPAMQTLFLDCSVIKKEPLDSPSTEQHTPKETMLQQNHQQYQPNEQRFVSTELLYQQQKAEHELLMQQYQRQQAMLEEILLMQQQQQQQQQKTHSYIGKLLVLQQQQQKQNQMLKIQLSKVLTHVSFIHAALKQLPDNTMIDSKTSNDLLYGEGSQHFKLFRKVQSNPTKIDLIPVNNESELKALEEKLNEEPFAGELIIWLKSQMTVLDSEKRMRTALDLLLTPKFQAECSWSGIKRSNNARNKIKISAYKNILDVIKVISKAFVPEVNDIKLAAFLKFRLKSAGQRWKNNSAKI